jgi:hypothetical protein
MINTAVISPAYFTAVKEAGVSREKLANILVSIKTILTDTTEDTSVHDILAKLDAAYIAAIS